MLRSRYSLTQICREPHGVRGPDLVRQGRDLAHNGFFTVITILIICYTHNYIWCYFYNCQHSSQVIVQAYTLVSCITALPSFENFLAVEQVLSTTVFLSFLQI
jgi:hypothetical protein